VKPVSRPVAIADTASAPVASAALRRAPPVAVQPIAESVVSPPARGGTSPSLAALAARPDVKIISPRARRLIRECVINADPIPGTGPRGRVVEKDVQAYLEAKHYAALKITPAAKNLGAQKWH